MRESDFLAQLHLLLDTMEQHLRNIHQQRATYDSEKEILALRRRIRRFFLGG